MQVVAQGESKARAALLERYAHVIAVNKDLDRTLVSFQANKSEPFYRWFKYKEGFSPRLVEYFLGRLRPKPGVLLDPFAGAGAALFASRELGWDSIGIELLRVGVCAMGARHSAEVVAPERFVAEVKKAIKVSFGPLASEAHQFRHLTITQGAFPPEAEREMSGFLAYCDRSVSDPHVRNLFQFACFCVLEGISYTRKDGQYLRWDARSPRTRVKGSFNKGRIPPFREAIRRKLKRMAHDMAENGLLKSDPSVRGTVDIRAGSCLEILPALRARSVDFILTSPPYCNRYDYTRTYALELAFLGHNDDDVKRLRQEMLSCTVENRDKVEQLEQAYAARRRQGCFEQVMRAFEQQKALTEVLGSLEQYRAAGTLNNANIPRMVRNYFLEMAFVVFELARVLRHGGHVVMVNDNVRYAGEEVPVDLILSEFARAFGLTVSRIWVLPRGKGNSSQQMGAHGRRELRKCVYVWEKR